jgi:prefoldin beta subunit
MEIPEQIKEDVVRLQALQQKMQAILVQKQTLQIQKVEVENALKEVGGAKPGEEVYEIVGAVMLKKNVKELSKSLKDKSEVFDLRLKSYDKQIKTINADLTNLQASIASKLKDKSGK